MLDIRCILNIICLLSFIDCKMEPFVVGGATAEISEFPHSMLLSVLCVNNRHQTIPYTCGASIINDRIALTAAHCVSDCLQSSQMHVITGHHNIDNGIHSNVHGHVAHEKYDSRKLTTDYDIGLVKLKTPLKLNHNVKRVALMKRPPYYEKAQIAGWGVYSELMHMTSSYLKFVDQYIWQRSACKVFIALLPEGTICASSGEDDAYAASGDSGSALLVRGYIQIGIVSFKVPTVSKSLVVYTDTGYYYDWIQNTAKRLYCA